MKLEKLATLHNKSYSKVTDYYKGLTDPMREIRNRVLSFVLEAKKIDSYCIGVPSLLPLEKHHSILDVGCATGDNLQLMFEAGFKELSGIDVAKGMIEEAKQRVEASFMCGDFFSHESHYDLVFAQAFVHLFPKEMLPQVILKLLSLSKKRVYFSTTIHEEGKEGLEPKGKVIRYRSRYTLPEILKMARSVLKKDPTLSFHYFFLKDPLGKYWINAVFERNDLHQIMKEKGVLLYKGFAEKETIQILLPEVEHFKEKKTDGVLRYDGEHVFDRVENFLPASSPALKELLDAENIVSKMMGEDAVLLKDKINFKLPGSGQFVPHQDAAAGWEKYGPNQITFALSFDPATEENGALYFAPGANQKGLLSPLRAPLDLEIVEKLNWELFCMEPGDALFFDAYAPHYSNNNRTKEPRRMAFLTYNEKKQGDHREKFFSEKRSRQPPMDERPLNAKLFRDKFGKLVYE